MDILFIVNDFSFEFLGIMSLSSVLKKAGHNVEVVLADYYKVKRKLKNNNFRTVAYSADSVHIKNYLALNQKIKEEFKVLSIFGGPHPTIFPEMIYEPGVDGICIGEGEHALLDLVNNLSENKPINNIANWWIKEDGKIYRNPPRPLIKNLDELPFADRKLFPDYSKIRIETSRGCFYRCSYCCEKGEFRQRTVDNVIEELKQIKPVRRGNFVYFSDPIFNLSLPWLKEFSERYKKEISLPFYCHTRPDLVTPEAIRCLKEANCKYISIGIETANDYLRNEILKKGLSKEQIIFAANTIKKAKIKLRTSVMLGIPYGSLKDDLETLKLNIRCGANYTEAHTLFIHRGLEIYDFLKREAKFNSSLISSKYCYFFYETLDKRQAIQIKNLHRIFGLITGIPILLPLASALIKLPFNKVYIYLYYMWEAFYHYVFILGRYTGIRGLMAAMKKYITILKEF